MIKLIDILKEHKGEEYPPYMYSPIGFSCAVCKYYFMRDKKHYCSNENYIEYKGTNELTDDSGKQITDPTKWCSNWFQPQKPKNNE